MLVHADARTADARSARPGPRGVRYKASTLTRELVCLLVVRCCLLRCLAFGHRASRAAAAVQRCKPGRTAACTAAAASPHRRVRGLPLRGSDSAIVRSRYRGFRIPWVPSGKNSAFGHRVVGRTIRLLYTNTKSPCSACKVRNARERALDALWEHRARPVCLGAPLATCTLPVGMFTYLLTVYWTHCGERHGALT